MRTRNLKPAFFKNDILGALNPLCRLLFSGLWCLADRMGRLEDRPLRIKAEILPFDDCNADELLTMLAENGFITRYSAEGKNYIEVTNFLRHQNPHMREAESIIPGPEEAAKPHNSAVCEESTAKAVPSPALNLNPYPLNLNPQPLTEKSGAPEKGEDEKLLSYLEKATGVTYRDRKARLAPIKRTLAKGFCRADLTAVIDKMTAEWQGTKYEKLLTPSHLFGEKFEEYLVRAPLEKKPAAPPGEVRASKLKFNSYSNMHNYSDEEIEKLFFNA